MYVENFGVDEHFSARAPARRRRQRTFGATGARCFPRYGDVATHAGVAYAIIVLKFCARRTCGVDEHCSAQVHMVMMGDHMPSRGGGAIVAGGGANAVKRI